MAAFQRFWKIAGPVLFAGALISAVFAQRAFRQYPSVEYGESIPLPTDWTRPAEWTFARLMFPPGPLDGYAGRFDGPWQEGLSLWTQDFPRADRHFSAAVRRLTRIQVRSVEQCVNLDDGDDIYNWPWLYAVQVGEWGISDAEAHKLRDYLLRGGFFMADDFHGTLEWQVFEASMKRVFPDRPIVDIPDSDAIFHTVYDLDDRYQVASMGSVNAGRSWKCENCPAQWRAIMDDQGRVMVGITFQSDVGDSWEWADSPQYPQEYAALGIRIGVNYIVYAMTH